MNVNEKKKMASLTAEIKELKDAAKDDGGDVSKRLKTQTDLNQNLTEQVSTIQNELTGANQDRDKAVNEQKKAADLTQKAVLELANLKTDTNAKIKEQHGTIEALTTEVDNLKSDGDITPEIRAKLWEEFSNEALAEAEKMAGESEGAEEDKGPDMSLYIPSETIEVGKEKRLHTMQNNPNAESYGGYSKGLAESLKQINAGMGISAVIKKMPAKHIPKDVSEEAQDQMDIHFLYVGGQIPLESFVSPSAVPDEDE